MTELEKMLAGKIYDPSDVELAKLRADAHNKCLDFNLLKDGDENKIKMLQAGQVTLYEDGLEEMLHKNFVSHDFAQ